MPCCGDDNDENTGSDCEEYGECIKHDPNFKGPLSKRSCTDVSCLVIFIAFLCCWSFIGFYAVKNGDLDRLLVPTDSEGRKCGYDNGVVDKKYLLFFDLLKCIDPYVPLLGCPTPQICVEECPKESFSFKEQECSQGGLELYRQKLKCKLDVNKYLIRHCGDIKQLIDEGKCAEWYSKSDSFLNRCISGLPTSECPYIPKRYYQQYARYLRTKRTLPTNESDPFHFVEKRQISNQIESFVPCEEKRKLGQAILIEKGHHVDSMLSRFIGNFISHFSSSFQAQELGQMIVEDIIGTWIFILLGLVAAMVVCLIIIAIMRWFATPLIWLSIFGFVAMLGAGCYFCFTRYIYLKKHPPTETTIITNVSKIFEKWSKNQNFWLYSGIVIAVILVIVLLVILVLRKRIVIAIALVKEGSKAVSSITSTVFFPIFPWIFHIAIIATSIIIGLYLASIGQPVNQIVRMNEDSNCQCVGEASAYRDGVICEPAIFNRYCTDRSSGLQFGRAVGQLTCKRAACNFKEIKSPPIIPYFQAINVVGFFWTMFFITALGEMVLAATFATWYWTFHKSDVPYFTLTVGLGRTIRYHLGTLAFGSLIVTICRIIRVILEYVDRKLKKYDNEVTKCLLCCCKCFFWCLEKFLRFINKNAYIMCAIHGKPFCTSARDAFNLLMRNFLRVIALDKVTEFVFFMTKVFITLGMGSITYVYFMNDSFGIKLHFIEVPVIIVMIGTYLIASVFFGVYSMAVDTLFMCFLEDCERNDGTPEKPYFMSKQLMKILGKRNKLPREMTQD